MSVSEIINNTVDNFTHTMREIFQQIKNKKCSLPLYNGQGDEWSYDPSGIIERISDRLRQSFESETRVCGLIGASSDGLIYDRRGSYDHKPLLSLLEDTLTDLRRRKFTSKEELQEFYDSFRARLWTLR